VSLVFVVEHKGRIEARKGLSSLCVAREWLREQGHDEVWVQSFVDIDSLVDPDNRFATVRIDDLTKVFFRGEEITEAVPVLTKEKIELDDAKWRAFKDPLVEPKPWFRT
jgi:hypothetical protein